jgi:hypothetical protein
MTWPANSDFAVVVRILRVDGGEMRTPNLAAIASDLDPFSQGRADRREVREVSPSSLEAGADGGYQSRKETAA